MHAITTLGCLTAAPLGTSEGVINPREYRIEDDFVHQKWYNMSVHDGLVKLDDQVVNFRVVANIIAIAGCTHTYGADQFKNTVNSYREYQGSETVTLGDCIKDALELIPSYSIIGVLGHSGDTACVALLIKAQGLANTINGYQGQGSQVISDFNPPRFQLSIDDTSAEMIDYESRDRGEPIPTKWRQ